MLGELLPQGGGDPIPLLKSKLMIGRRESCDISLRFPNVSSHHCELELMNGYWHVRDLGSSNGIKVNGVRVDSKWLMPGDELSVAKHHYKISYTSLSDGPPPAEEDVPELSLMEKAGLTKRRPEPSTPPDRGSQASSPKTPSSKPDRSKSDHSRPRTDEERALDWLKDDDTA